MQPASEGPLGSSSNMAESLAGQWLCCIKRPNSCRGNAAYDWRVFVTILVLPPGSATASVHLHPITSSTSIVSSKNALVRKYEHKKRVWKDKLLSNFILDPIFGCRSRQMPLDPFLCRAFGFVDLSISSPELNATSSVGLSSTHRVVFTGSWTLLSHYKIKRAFRALLRKAYIGILCRI